jgi:RNA polymerase sigma factor (sigma-70 family)
MAMATGQMNRVIQYLRGTMGPRDGAGLSDAQLLTAYLSRHDQAALAALVHRHGPLVWGACRRVLRSHHDAEDAFQATFLVLVRKAASIASRELLANWLYGVAYQTALKARATAARRRERERQGAGMPEPAVAEPDVARDLRPILDEELSRLPDKYRAVIVLCDLEGKTRKEAARQLRCPEGTVAGRLVRARVLLAKRLTRRGVALSSGALAAVLAQNLVSASVPMVLVSSTLKAASQWAAGQAAGAIAVQVAALTEGVLKAMLLRKIKAALVVLLGVILVGLGSGATALLARDEGGRVGYQPPGLTPAGPVNIKVIVVQPQEVALDAAGGRAKPYFYSPPDPSNINHLWKLAKAGDYYMIESKVGEFALDAAGGRGNPYLRHSDPTNINHLWKLVKVDACYLLLPKAGDGELALDANGGRGNPYFRKADTSNNNHLWQLRKVGDDFMIIPLVRREAAPAVQGAPSGQKLLQPLFSKEQVRWPARK